MSHGLMAVKGGDLSHAETLMNRISLQDLRRPCLLSELGTGEGRRERGGIDLN